MSLQRLSSEPVFDVRGALARLAGDEELLGDLIEFFLEDAPPLLDQLCSAVESNDPEEIKRAAHALKGLVAGCGGTRAAYAAQQLEHAGQAGDLSDSAMLIDALKLELESLKRATLSYRK